MEASAGSSARGQQRRAREQRQADLRSRWGKAFGSALSWVTDETAAETRWRRGAEGEEIVARRLEKLLRDTPVELLHDRRIPGKVSNIDHIAVGPTGVTVIDAKRWKGDVRVRGGQLMVKGRDQSRLVEGVRKQMLVIDGVLTDLPPVPIHGFICWVNGEGLPTFGKLELQGVRIDGAKRIAKELKRDGPTTLERVLVLRDLLARRLPAAA